MSDWKTIGKEAKEELCKNIIAFCGSEKACGECEKDIDTILSFFQERCVPKEQKLTKKGMLEYTDGRYSRKVQEIMEQYYVDHTTP